MNLFVIINDGFRWQEVFCGADPQLLNDKKLVNDPTIIEKFNGDTEQTRKQKLLPFLWNVIDQKGILLGNRNLNSRVNAANLQSKSYPGYNEIFTGQNELFLFGNKRYNRNKNVLEYLDQKPIFKNNIAVFASWNIFPYILNKKRNDLFINCGNGNKNDKIIHARNFTLKNDKEAGTRSKETRYDHITCREAKKYIQEYHPKIVVIAFGEGDVQAHRKGYDIYLQKAYEIDEWTEGLWNMLQADDFYKEKTNLIMCTDHGRGSNSDNWYDHGFFVKGSSETWLALLGPSVHTLEIKNKEQLYNKQIASLIGRLVGETF